MFNTKQSRAKQKHMRSDFVQIVRQKGKKIISRLTEKIFIKYCNKKLNDFIQRPLASSLYHRYSSKLKGLIVIYHDFRPDCLMLYKDLLVINGSVKKKVSNKNATN